MKRFTTIAAGFVTVAVLIGGGLVAWMRYAPRQTPAGQPPLAMLDGSSLQTFRDAFNAHTDETRIVVMLSPT